MDLQNKYIYIVKDTEEGKYVTDVRWKYYFTGRC